MCFSTNAMHLLTCHTKSDCGSCELTATLIVQLEGVLQEVLCINNAKIKHCTTDNSILSHQQQE